MARTYFSGTGLGFSTTTYTRLVSSLEGWQHFEGLFKKYDLGRWSAGVKGKKRVVLCLALFYSIWTFFVGGVRLSYLAQPTGRWRMGWEQLAASLLLGGLRASAADDRPDEFCACTLFAAAVVCSTVNKYLLVLISPFLLQKNQNRCSFCMNGPMKLILMYIHAQTRA